ncbi:MAG: hypothetical protein O2962_01755 [Cyanobacteria bacterium]|nr:hypothetical protein [Cyanobacteriota bacterium]
MAVFVVVVLISFAVLKDRAPAGEQVKTKFRQGKVLASNSWYLESPFVLDDVIASKIERELYSAFSNQVTGSGEYNYRFIAPANTELVLSVKVKDPRRTPRIWLYNSEAKMVQKAKMTRFADHLEYRFKTQEEDMHKIKVYFDYDNLVSLKLNAKPQDGFTALQLRKNYMSRALKTLEIDIAANQVKALKELTSKQFEIFKHYKTNPLPSDVASRPLKKTDGRVLIKVKTPGDTWSLASMGIAGRTFEHQDLGKLFGSVDIKLLSGQLPLNMKRFKLYTLQAKSFTRDFIFEQSLKDHGLLVPRQDLVKVIVNGELYGFMELLETPVDHFFEYAQKQDGIIYGYNAGAIHDKLRNAKFVEEYGGKSKTSKKGEKQLASIAFANEICKPQMDLFSSFVYGYGAIHGTGHGDLTFHDNVRLDCLNPIPRDMTTGLFSPYFKGDKNDQHVTLASAISFYDLIAPKWRPDIVGRTESFLLRDSDGFQPDLSFHWFAQMPASLRYYFSGQNLRDLIEYSKYWNTTTSKTKLINRIKNLVDSLSLEGNQLYPGQANIIQIVTYYLQNAINLVTNHPKTSITGIDKNINPYLARIINAVSAGELKPNEIDLQSLATRNAVIDKLGLSAEGLDLTKYNSIINFLYRDETETEARMVFVERLFDTSFSQGDFRLKERKTDQIIEPTKKIVIGSEYLKTNKTDLALTKIKANEKLIAYYFKLPKTDTYRYFTGNPTGDKHYWGSREIAIGPVVNETPKTYQQEDPVRFFDIAGKSLQIKSKMPVITKTLEIKKGYSLRIDKDSEMVFADNGCLMVYGNLELVNDARLKLTGDSWSGIHFIDTQDQDLRNIEIDNIGDGSYGVTCGGRPFSGGLSFFNTKANIVNLKINDSNIEDAMHVLNSEVTMQDSELITSQSDAIDTDYSNVAFTNIKLAKSQGDGLDVSGSLVLIRDSKSIDQIDKGLSIGENSNVYVYNSVFSAEAYCIAVKDSSRLHLDKATQLIDCQTELGEYIKKSYFTKPEVIRN